MRKLSILTAVAAASLAAVPAAAQVSSQRPNPLEAIFGALFGDRPGVTTSIESRWAAGRTPLYDQRVQFHSRVDAETRAGNLAEPVSERLKYDYDQLVDLETRYGGDRTFTAAERSDLTQRYAALTQVLSTGSYGDGATAAVASVAEGQTDFNRRVDAATAARRLSRTQGTRLKADYAAAVRLETTYMRDRVLTTAERNDLDARLDALDARVPELGAASTTLTQRQRLDAITRAIPTAGLGMPARTRLQVELSDLSRLEAAYARLNPTAEERAYLDSRIADLETRARLR
jgi:hypothetical protein